MAAKPISIWDRGQATASHHLSMKFGKYLALRQLELPEYSGHFIDYKALKKLIKQLAVQLSGESLQANKASFFFRVERELDKVNSFYLEKQANLAINLDLLLVKKSELVAKGAPLAPGGAAAAAVAATSSASGSTSTLRNSILYLSLYQNFQKIHQDLIRLQQFIELNETGFLKVVKKWDKRSKSHTKELFILSAVLVQPVFHKNEINELSDLVTQSLFDLETLVDGDFGGLTHVRARTSSAAATAAATAAAAAAAAAAAGSPVPAGATSAVHSASAVSDEIDVLYSSFINVATIKDPDHTLLSQWIDKIRQLALGDASDTIRAKLSKVFLLAIPNLKISDAFLELFLDLIAYDIDFSFVLDDLNNKNIVHECCLIALVTNELRPPPHHVVINNGVKVTNLSDSIVHTRAFVVRHLVQRAPAPVRTKLLTLPAFNGRTCLHYAAQNNRVDLLDMILPVFPAECVDVLDNESMSALLVAIKHNNLAVIKQLIDFGADCFPPTGDGRLQYLPINYACKMGSYQVLEYILRQHRSRVQSINQQDVEGLFPLHVLARLGHHELIKLLIEYGAEVNQIDGLNNWTPLFYSVLEGYVATTQELVRNGAKLDLVDEDGYNVLYYCVVEGHIKVLNILLSYYDDIFGTNSGMQGLAKDDLLSATAAAAGTATNTNRGDSDAAALRLEHMNPSSIDSAMATVDEGAAPDDSDNDDPLDDNLANVNDDASIPDLKLPPPILPLRRYGHNFLEQKVLIELIFPPNHEFITLFNSVADLKPGRLTLTSNISDIVPRNILLPMTDDTMANHNCIFQTETDSLHEFRIDFEIFPKFGTRLIAKTTALLFLQIDTLSPEINAIQLPLFDLRLRNIGELKFSYQVIFPFAGTLLETSKFDTYWKLSTSFVKNRQVLKLNAAGGLSPNNFLTGGAGSRDNEGNIGSAMTLTNDLMSSSTPSLVVTATSLLGEYLRIKVCLLNDGTPIVCPFWLIALTDEIDLYLPNLLLEQLNSITSDLFDYSKVIADLSLMTLADLALIKKLLKIIYLPLAMLLDVLNFEINLNLEIVYPLQYELKRLPIVSNVQLNLNRFIDTMLNNVFNHIRNHKLRTLRAGNRSIIFLSSNSLICKILNWKQPNFPVFLIMNGIKYNTRNRTFESRTTNGLPIDPADEATRDDQEMTIRLVKEAVNFTINNNLIGLISSVHLLNLVPKLVPLIRLRGLVLVASSDAYDNQEQDERYILGKGLDAYTKTDINGLRFNDVLSFKEDVTM